MNYKKLLIGCLILLFSTGKIFAQDAQMEAKAAYELAEDAYSKANYKSALNFLQQVKTSLGSTNCKILFLEIMVTQELLAKDTSRNTKLMGLITAFEKSTDYADFNQEKKMEVTKLKLSLRSEQAELQRVLDSAKEARELRLRTRTDAHRQAVITAAQIKGAFGISLEELDKANPKWKVKKWVAYKASATVDIYHDPAFYYDETWFPFPTMKDAYTAISKVCGVYVKDGKVIGYTETADFYNYITVGPDASKYYNTRLAQQANILAPYIQAFQLDPITTPIVFKEATGNRYRFTEKNYGVLIEEIHAPFWGMVLKTVFYNTTDKPTVSYHPSER